MGYEIKTFVFDEVKLCQKKQHIIFITLIIYSCI